MVAKNSEPIEKQKRLSWSWWVAWGRGLGPRLLDWRLPVVKTYLALTIGALVLFGLSIGALHLLAQRWVVVPEPGTVEDASEAYRGVYPLYGFLLWNQSGHNRLEQLAAANPDNPWPLAGQSHLLC